MSPHFLQSAAWQAFQEARGRQVFERSGEGWQYRAILEPGTLLSPARLYCPYGPTITSERALATALESLRALGRSLKVGYIRIEPLGAEYDARKLKLREVSYSQPSHTLQVDLTPNKDTIVANMKQNNRSIYRNYSKKGLSYHQSDDPADIRHLLTLLHEVAASNKITVHSDEYLTQQAETLLPLKAAKLHLMRYEDDVIAAALTYHTDTTCYYAHAGASHEHRKLAASTALLAEIIMDAKKDGLEVCDLYGITTSDDPKHPWAGFTRFKKSFGGKQVDLSPTYELPLRSFHYSVYRLFKSVLKIVRSTARLLLK